VWYGTVFHGSGFGAPALRSLGLATAATAASLAVGALLALALTRYRFPGRRLFEGFVLAPLIVPKVALGIAAFILFFKVGIYGTFGSLVLVHIVVTLPFVMTLLVAGFLRVDRTIEEAAADLGANGARVLWRATLPQMRGALAAAAAFSFIISFDELDASIFVVGQHANTLPVAMFLYMQKFQSPTLAALSSLLIGGSLLAAVGVGFILKGVGGVRGLGSERMASGRPPEAGLPDAV
jgi:ABC-type spermidine/putrescine transport system permease subunit II